MASLIQDNELSSILFERGLIPRALFGLSDKYLEPFIPQIIEREIELFYKVKEADSFKAVCNSHYDQDLKEGRIKHDKNFPSHMYG